MGRKRIQKIPKAVSIKCPYCAEKMRLSVPIDSSIQKVECRKCKQVISTPLTQCCIICAFSNKKCPSNLLIEARAKGLEVR